MATWSDYNNTIQTNNNKDMDAFAIAGTVLGGGQLTDMLNNVGTADAVEQSAEAIRNQMKQNQTPFYSADSLDSLLAMGRNYSDMEGIDTTFNWKDFYGNNVFGDIFEGAGRGASIGTSIMPGWGTLIGAAAGTITGGLFHGSNEAKARAEADRANKITSELNEDINTFNKRNRASFNLAASNLQNTAYRQSLTNMAAFGGPLHEYGTDWRTGLTEINAGGTHGQNPYGGVPYGVAQDGEPNLVEEGEAIWNDYVFSNRMEVPEEVKKMYKLSKNIKTYADAVKKLTKELDERPNDPIAKRSHEKAMSDLMQSQENLRQKQAEKEAFEQDENLAAIFADGGPIHIAKNKRGTFTAAATKHGMGVQEFASKVLAHPENYSPAMRKKAQFAHNSAGWSHAYGGYLEGQVYDISEQEYNRLKQLGYEIEVI